MASPALRFGAALRPRDLGPPGVWLGGIAAQAELERVQCLAQNPAHQRLPLCDPLEPFRQPLGRRRLPRVAGSSPSQTGSGLRPGARGTGERIALTYTFL